MIPVSLYGVDVDRCEEFYAKLPGVADSIDDEDIFKGPICYPRQGIHGTCRELQKIGQNDNHLRFLKKLPMKLK